MPLRAFGCALDVIECYHLVFVLIDCMSSVIIPKPSLEGCQGFRVLLSQEVVGHMDPPHRKILQPVQ